MFFHRTRTSLLSNINNDKKTPVCNVLTEKLTLQVASFSKMCTSQTVFQLEHQLYKISAFGPFQHRRWRLIMDNCQAVARFLFWKLQVVHFKSHFNPIDQYWTIVFVKGQWWHTLKVMVHSRGPRIRISVLARRQT